MKFKSNSGWEISLLASYVGSIYLYTINSSALNSGFSIIVLLVAIVSFIVSLYKIWHEYLPDTRIQLYTQLALFAFTLHAITIPVNYFFGGIIGGLVGLLIIYLFLKKILTS